MTNRLMLCISGPIANKMQDANKSEDNEHAEHQDEENALPENSFWGKRKFSSEYNR